MRVLDFAMLCLAVSISLTLYRVVKGPDAGSRITAFDFLGVNLAVLVVLVAWRTGYRAFLDAALVMSILGFLSTVAFSLYLLRGRLIK
ncbi:MAG TPA: monovalent cation/H+ antiporter complex subunit F [Trueperaceae bacterium]|nr:monovalent cation/H+ antiporter complex subunit F [Trueperaceae bacterium]